MKSAYTCNDLKETLHFLTSGISNDKEPEIEMIVFLMGQTERKYFLKSIKYYKEIMK